MSFTGNWLNWASSAMLWHLTLVPVKAGDRVTQGQRLVIVESMKMEIVVTAPRRGTVVKVPGAQGTRIATGQALVFLKPEVG